jgi:hypothetical protein
MNKELFTALCEALYWRKAYSDSNPDVGMGPSLETLLDSVLRRTGINLKDEERLLVVTKVEMAG